MKLEIAKGKLTLIGAGSWRRGETMASVIEIGGKKFYDVLYSDLMSSYRPWRQH